MYNYIVSVAFCNMQLYYYLLWGFVNKKVKSYASTLAFKPRDLDSASLLLGHGLRRQQYFNSTLPRWLLSRETSIPLRSFSVTGSATEQKRKEPEFQASLIPVLFFFVRGLKAYVEAADGNRTRDLRTTNATLYRLSHSSTSFSLFCVSLSATFVSIQYFVVLVNHFFEKILIFFLPFCRNLIFITNLSRNSVSYTLLIPYKITILSYNPL